MSVNMYAVPDELKLDLNIGLTKTAYDPIIERTLEAATRSINRACNRPDGFVADAVASARLYTGTGRNYQPIDEFVGTPEVAVKDSMTETTYTAWLPTDWIAYSGDYRWPDFNSTPYTGIMIDGANGNYSTFTSGNWGGRGGWKPVTDYVIGLPTVQVTAQWGFALTVPADIKEACIMQAARWYKRLQSAMSDSLATGELGILAYRQSLDPDIKRLLVEGRYIRPAIGRRP